jgi:hypothetical protein
MNYLTTEDGKPIRRDNPLAVQLSGSIPEYGWLDTDIPPAPADPAKLALGVEINTTTNEMTTKYWNGTVWVEVL